MAFAGRPRKEGQRTPSGALSRAQSAYQDDRLGIHVRMRRYRLEYDDARDARAGSVIGRLALAEQISREQELAALYYRAVVEAWRRAIKAPQALLRRDRTKPAADEVTPGYLDWVLEASAELEQLRRALRRHQARNRDLQLTRALDLMALQDVEAPALLQDLREALAVIWLAMATSRR